MSDPGSSSSGVDEAARRRFETAWIKGQPQPIDSFLPPEQDPRRLPTLEELVHIELEFAWKSCPPEEETAGPAERTQTQPPIVENYLERFASLDQPSIVARLVEQECRVAAKPAMAPPVEEYRQRFPELVVEGSELESVLETVATAGQEVTTGVGGPEPKPDEPRCFGGYELLEEIGCGGMGVVYRARQSNAERVVALKVIRRDWLASMPADARTSALDRFRQEAQAAARIEHENIVTVYDVGDVAGEPFFSMRYVDGRSLADILRDGPIASRPAAAYFEAVARAVDEAHRRGILHRDLKPQNILVDRKSDVPLVADFGLAKLVQNNDELTCAGDVIGSPPYMSPEQAGDSSQATTQSDVYALGAALYHVLTGQPPFRAATALETLNKVMREEPSPPRQLNSAIDRDLETICLKCLQKEPSRRYVSADALANDLRRYRDGEPILARPVVVFERAWLWGRRNPLVAGLVASTAAFLMLALAASVVGYVKTSSALDTAKERHRETRRVINHFFTRVSEDKLLNEPGMQPLRKELLEDVLTYYQQFLAEFADDSTIRDELAMTHFRVGRITEEIASPDDAYAWYERSRRMQSELLAEAPDDPEILQSLGDTSSAMGRVLHRARRLEQARAAHKQAIRIRTRLVEGDPESKEFRRTLANSHMNLGLFEKDVGDVEMAGRQFRQAQAIRRAILKEHPDCPETRRDAGIGFYSQALLSAALASPVAEESDPQLDEAGENVQRAIVIFEELLREDSRNLANQYRLVLCCRHFGSVEWARGNLDAAIRLYGRALEQIEILVLRNPEVLEYQADSAGLRIQLGALKRDRGDPRGAREEMSQAQATLEGLVEREPRSPRYRRDLAVSLREMAVLLKEAGEVRQAGENLQAARKRLSELVAEFPDNPGFALDLAETPVELDDLAPLGR